MPVFRNGSLSGSPVLDGVLCCISITPRRCQYCKCQSHCSFVSYSCLVGSSPSASPLPSKPAWEDPWPLSSTLTDQVLCCCNPDIVEVFSLLPPDDLIPAQLMGRRGMGLLSSCDSPSLPTGCCPHRSRVWGAERNGRRLGNLLFAQRLVTSSCLRLTDVCSCLLLQWVFLGVPRDFLAGPLQALPHHGSGSLRGSILTIPHYAASY